MQYTEESMHPQGFLNNFLQLCKDMKFEVQENVLLRIKKVQSSQRLDLASQSLSLDTCKVLGKVLIADMSTKEIDLSDCMLPPKALQAIAIGLSKNECCQKINLRGNDIQGDGASVLGAMLSQNASLLSLSLEWNSLGVSQDQFGLFGVSLGQNSSLRELDLRSNRLDHRAAAAIAAALRKNCTLHKLDLRWNNIGRLGGEAMQKALELNTQLGVLLLHGNEIPREIESSIASMIVNNAENLQATGSLTTKNELLSQKIQSLAADREKHLSEMQGLIRQQEKTHETKQRNSSQQIKHLKELLDERKSHTNQLLAKLSEAESEFALSSSRLAELEEQLNVAQSQEARLTKTYHQETQRLKEVHALTVNNLQKSLQAETEKLLALDSKLQGSERDGRLLREENLHLRERIHEKSAELKVKSSEFDERMNSERQKRLQDLNDLRMANAAEVNRIREESSEGVAQLREREGRLEEDGRRAQADVARLQQKLREERLSCEERLQSTKGAHAAALEQMREDARSDVARVEAGRGKVEEMYKSLAESHKSCGDRHRQQALELQRLQHEAMQMKTEVDGKDHEVATAVSRTRIELENKIRKLEAERSSQEDLYSRITDLEKLLTEQQTTNKLQKEHNEGEVKKLQEKNANLERELQQIRNDFSQRAAILKNAFVSFTSSPAFRTDLS